MAYIGVATDDPTLAGVRFTGVPGSASGRPTAFYSVSVTLSPAAVAADTSAEQTFSVPGVAVGDVVFVNKPTAQAGLGIVGARVSAANQIAVTFVNATAASITPTASQSYLIGGIRTL
jgi:hypothetical protein